MRNTTIDLCCERCGEFLNPNAITWLELSYTDGLYYKSIPAGHKSQGAFSFGKKCAKIILEETKKEKRL